MQLTSPNLQIKDLLGGGSIMPSWAPLLSGNMNDLQKTVMAAEQQAARAALQKMIDTHTSASRTLTMKQPAYLLRKCDDALRRLIGQRSEHRLLQAQLLQYEDSLADLQAEIDFIDGEGRRALLLARTVQAIDARHNRQSALERQRGRGEVLAASPLYSGGVQLTAAEMQGHLASISVTGNTAMDAAIDSAYQKYSGVDVSTLDVTSTTTDDLSATLQYRYAEGNYYLYRLHEARAAEAMRQTAIDLGMRELDAQQAAGAAQLAVEAAAEEQQAHAHRVARARAQLARLLARADGFTNNYQSRIAVVLQSYAKTAYELDDVCHDLALAMRQLGYRAVTFSASSFLESAADDEAELARVGDELRAAERDWEVIEARGVRTMFVAKGVLLAPEAIHSMLTGDTQDLLSGTVTLDEILDHLRVEAIAIAGDAEENGLVSVETRTEVVSTNGLGLSTVKPGEPWVLQWPVRLVTRAAAATALSPCSGAFLVNLRPKAKIKISLPSGGRAQTSVDVYLQIVGTPSTPA